MNQRGYVLIIVICLLAILMIIALSFSGYAHFSLMRGSQTKDSLQMLYLAKSGVQAARIELKTKPAPGKTTAELIPQMDPIASDMKLTYTAEWQPAEQNWIDAVSKYGVTGSLYQITAIGYVKFKDEDRAIRTVFALVDISNPEIPIVYWEDLGNQIKQQY